MCLINYNNAWIGECIWYCKVTSRLLNIYHHEAYPPLICWQWTILHSGQLIPNTISKFRSYRIWYKEKPLDWTFHQATFIFSHTYFNSSNLLINISQVSWSTFSICSCWDKGYYLFLIIVFLIDALPFNFFISSKLFLK